MMMALADHQQRMEEEEEEVLEVEVHLVLLGLARVFPRVDARLAVDLSLVLKLKVILRVC